MLPACQFLTILTSKSLSRAGVVQILSISTSKSAPGLPVLNDFDFQIAFARRRGANFVDILGNRSFATSVFRTYLCELSKRQNYGKTQHFAQFLPAKTSLLSNIDAARAPGNFQYSRKLELLNFLWLYKCFSVSFFFNWYVLFTIQWNILKHESLTVKIINADEFHCSLRHWPSTTLGRLGQWLLTLGVFLMFLRICSPMFLQFCFDFVGCIFVQRFYVWFEYIWMLFNQHSPKTCVTPFRCFT